MHELSLAINIVNIVTNEMARFGATKIAAVHVKLGPLSGVAAEALQTAFRLATHETPLNGSALVIQDTPITVYCENCQCEQKVKSLHSMVCSVCGRPSCKVLQGRELEVCGLEIEQNEAPDTAG